MPKFKFDIKKLRDLKNALVLLGQQKLPYTFQINKSLKSINKAIQEYEQDDKDLKESFYELADEPKGKSNNNVAKQEGTKKFKQYLAKLENKRLVLVRDNEGQMIEVKDGDLKTPSTITANAVADDKVEEYLEEKKKIDAFEYEVDIHQILEDSLENDLRVKFDKTGESIDSNITEPLQGIVIVQFFDE